MSERLPNASAALERRSAWKKLSIRKRREALRAARDVYEPGMSRERFEEEMQQRLGFGWEALIPVALELFKIIVEWFKNRKKTP